jgi:hypothetical protein
LRRVNVPTLRAALWALVQHHRLRRRLRRNGLKAAPVPAPLSAAPEATRGVTGILRRRNATCLERALVLQRWYAAQGIERDVVIGVASPDDEFAAHAWLDGDPEEEPVSAFSELHRLSP